MKKVIPLLVLLIVGIGLMGWGQVTPKWTVDIISLNYQGSGVHSFETFLNCPNSPEIKEDGSFVVYLENGSTQAGVLIPGHQRLRWKQNP